MKAVALVFALTASSAFAAASNPEAELAITEAEALGKAKLFDDALAAIERALKLAPQNPDALRVRAQLRLAIVPPVPAETTVIPGYDYPKLLAWLDASLNDFDQALALMPPMAPTRSALKQQRDALAVRRANAESMRAGVEQAVRVAEQQRQAAALAEQRRQEQARADEAARVEAQARAAAAQAAERDRAAAEQARLREQQKLERAQRGVRLQRGFGIAGVAVGGVLGAISVGFMVGGASNNELIKHGPLPTSDAILEAEQKGRDMNLGVAVFGIPGAVALGVGIALLATIPAAPRTASISVGVGPSSIVVSGSF